jgi:hypothetical protein
VGLRSGLDGVEKKRFLTLPGLKVFSLSDIKISDSAAKFSANALTLAVTAGFHILSH